MDREKLSYRCQLHFYSAARWLKALFGKPKATEPKSILLAATVLLGDFIMMAPLVQSIRKTYPNAKLTVLVPAGWSEFAKLMIGVDQVLEAKINNGTWLKEFRRQYHGQFDAGIIAFVYFAIPLFYALGIKHIISFPGPQDRYGYQIADKRAYPKQAAHMSRMLLQVMQDQNGQYPAPHFRDASYALPAELQNLNYVIVHPGASRKTRFWPAERYIAVAKLLLAKGYQVVLTGAKSEKPLADAIAEGLPKEGVINLAGATNLVSLLATVQNAQAVLGPDTGIMHMARACNTKSVTIMGPTQVELYGVDPSFHDINRHRTLYIPNLSCRNEHTSFKVSIPGVANCYRSECLYANTPCLLGIEIAMVQNALAELGILCP
jgi:ADP-heptose:LPS heptosyltransferase